MKRTFLVFLSLAAVFARPALAAEPAAKDPIYLRLENGWEGLYGHNTEYAQYELSGKTIQIQDAYHLLLNPNLGLVVAFVGKDELGNGKDLLSAHAEWEVNYWRGRATGVESKTRSDLGGGRTDLKVTEIRVRNNDGRQITSYLIGLASSEGVFALSISPVDKSLDAQVKNIIASFKLVRRRLDADEVQRVSAAVRGKL